MKKTEKEIESTYCRVILSLMLPSVEIDIADIGRFTGLTREKDGVFLQKFFTPSELDYCV